MPKSIDALRREVEQLRAVQATREAMPIVMFRVPPDVPTRRFDAALAVLGAQNPDSITFTLQIDEEDYDQDRRKREAARKSATKAPAKRLRWQAMLDAAYEALDRDVDTFRKSPKYADFLRQRTLDVANRVSTGCLPRHCLVEEIEVCEQYGIAAPPEARDLIPPPMVMR